MTKEAEYYNLLHAHSTHAQAHGHHSHAKAAERHAKIPVTVIGGFLGAGKTTLVNHLVSQSADHPVDVLLREYSELSIDDQLIQIDPKRMHTFPGISLHYDPQIMLYGFMDRLHENGGDQIEHLLLETSGLDEPEYLARLFMLPKIRDKYQLACNIVLVDAEFAHLNLAEYAIATEQLAYADVILINKVDLVRSKEVKKLARRFAGVNGLADIYKTQFARIDLDKIGRKDTYEQLNKINPSKKNIKRSNMQSIQTVSLVEKRPMDKKKTNAWLDQLFRDESIKLLRSKGMFHFANSDYRFEFQAVRTSFHSKADQVWRENEERKSTVVLIGEGLDVQLLQKQFAQCV